MKRRILYFSCLTAFVVLLLTSNHLVAILAPNNFKRIKDNINSISGNEIQYAIDTFNDEDQTLFESVQFVGWAFLPENKRGEKNETGIALVGHNKDIYLYKAAPNMMRADVNVLCGDSDNHGFNYTISTISVPSGVYTVYVYCGDGGENQGIISTEYILEKNGKNVSVYSTASKEEHISDVNDDEVSTFTSLDAEAQTFLDIVTVNENGSASIAGWAYVPEKDAAAQQIQLLLTFSDGTASLFDAQQISRPDVAEAFSSELYTMAGFNALIPAEGLATQNFTVSVLVKDADGLHTSPEMLAAAQAGATVLAQ